jgi:hypothetical protein
MSKEELKPKYRINDVVRVDNENYEGLFVILGYTVEDNSRVSYKADSPESGEFWFGEEEVTEYVV